MSGEPTHDSGDKPQPTMLGYARHVGEYPQLQSHHWVIVLLIGLAALAGVWSIILGAMSLGDAWLFGILLTVGGVCLCWATLGKLSAKGMRLRAALLLLAISFAMHLPVILMANEMFQRQSTRYARQIGTGGSDVLRPVSAAELETFSYELFRNQALISVALGVGCAIYTAARLIRRRGVDFN
ncbi:MAG TPA: hypothetical protein VH370_18910 [Humisphaera sp.]|jgi:hypothetical protein|nr:hypothetical protein [Humisphaera sp.]